MLYPRTVVLKLSRLPSSLCVKITHIPFWNSVLEGLVYVKQYVVIYWSHSKPLQLCSVEVSFFRAFYYIALTFSTLRIMAGFQYCFVSSQGKCQEYRESRRQEENTGLLEKKEEQRRKVHHKGSEADGLNLRTSPPLLVHSNIRAKHRSFAKTKN